MDIVTKHWMDVFRNEQDDAEWWLRKRELFVRRGADIVRINGDGQIFRKMRYDDQQYFHYNLHLSFLVRQGDFFYVEETVTPYQFQLKNGRILQHEEIRVQQGESQTVPIFTEDDPISNVREQRVTYDRLAAVKYAEHWWNSYNPAYPKFDVDCTNFISQCLRAGGAPMRGMPNRSKGWWYEADNWSFSWSVAHSLRWYLSGQAVGLQGKEVVSAADLHPGDVICYDFQGDGRWDHNTIVVTKDAQGMPLVNAHTDNSRHRYWSYEDSTAWTPNIQYKFFQIEVS